MSTEVEKMRYVVYGAGGVGASIGAALHQRGHEVTLIARGAHLDALRTGGLAYRTPERDVTLRIPVVGHPQEIDFRPDDVVLLAMKTQDTAGALADLASCGVDDLPLICAQNGVENERIAARRFPRVYGMAVWLPAVFLEPGVVLNYSTGVGGILDTGRYPDGTDSVVRQLTSDLEASGMSSRPDPRIMRWKYSKLLTNLRTALPAVVGADANIDDFAGRVREEAIACYRAAGIDWTSHEEEERRRAESGMSQDHIDGKRREGGSSWQSIARGLGSIETDYMNGEIVLMGAELRVPTPYNRALQVAANRVAKLRLPPGSMSLGELEALARRDLAGE